MDGPTLRSLRVCRIDEMAGQSDAGRLWSITGALQAAAASVHLHGANMCIPPTAGIPIVPMVPGAWRMQAARAQHAAPGCPLARVEDVCMPQVHPECCWQRALWCAATVTAVTAAVTMLRAAVWSSLTSRRRETARPCPGACTPGSSSAPAVVRSGRSVRPRTSWGGLVDPTFSSQTSRCNPIPQLASRPPKAVGDRRPANRALHTPPSIPAQRSTRSRFPFAAPPPRRIRSSGRVPGRTTRRLLAAAVSCTPG